MKTLRKIAGKMYYQILDQERSTNVRGDCNTENNEWMYKRKRKWNQHTSRMEEGRIVGIAREQILY